MSEHARLPADLTLTAGAARRRWMPALAAGLSIGEYARSVERRLALLAAVLVLAVWALAGQGYFWPAWVWLGVGVLMLLDFSAGWAWRRPAGAVRRVACVWALVAVAAVILMFTWLLTWLLAGAHTFWPAWALFGLASAGSAYSLIALQDRVLVARGRRALRARIDLLTHTRARPWTRRRRAAPDRARPPRRRAGAAGRAGDEPRDGRAEARAHDPAAARELIAEARAGAEQALRELRDLARGIHPPVLADRGLEAAVGLARELARCRSAVSGRHVAAAGPAPVESAAYFVVAEALDNAAKHAHAQRAEVPLERSSARALRVEVGDDGVRRRRRRRRRAARAAPRGSRRSTARSPCAARRAADDDPWRELPCGS